MGGEDCGESGASAKFVRVGINGISRGADEAENSLWQYAAPRLSCQRSVAGRWRTHAAACMGVHASTRGGLCRRRRPQDEARLSGKAAARMSRREGDAISRSSVRAPVSARRQHQGGRRGGGPPPGTPSGAPGERGCTAPATARDGGWREARQFAPLPGGCLARLPCRGA